ncbi:hypothetical protein C8039_05485 [Halogeometricum sp. wsp3]|nr:hypothetical protein C8039_05485 [Halogeometricum sp. wsp3]
MCRTVTARELLEFALFPAPSTDVHLHSRCYVYLSLFTGSTGVLRRLDGRSCPDNRLLDTDDGPFPFTDSCRQIPTAPLRRCRQSPGRPRDTADRECRTRTFTRARSREALCIIK